MRPFKRILSMFLALLMVASLLPLAVIADNVQKARTLSAYQPLDQAIKILAEADNTVTVESETDEPDINGILDIQAGSYEIERDYEQTCKITVTNNSDKTVEFYLEADNPYSDLSLEIIKSGSDESPVVILAGEELEVELSVFAQNAENERYSIPITAYVKDDDKYTADGQATATLNCELPSLNLNWKLISEDESTLRKKYKLTNNGDTVTDLVLSASGDAADYLSFDPILSNYELAAGASVEFTAQPDLAKMKNNGVSKVEGYLVATSAGKTSQVACTFDTNGEEITVTTMGELARQQDGNPYTKFEIIEDSIALEYFDGEKYVEATSTDITDYLDNDNQFDFKIGSSIDTGVETPLGFDMQFKSQKITDPDFEYSSEPVVTFDETGTMYVKIGFLLSSDEYKSLLTHSQSVFLYSVPTLASYEYEEDSSHFLVEAFFTISDFLDEWLGEDGLISDILDDALGLEFVSTSILGDLYDAAESFIAFGEILTNPEFSLGEKAILFVLEVGNLVLAFIEETSEFSNPLMSIGLSIIGWLYDWIVEWVTEKFGENNYPSGDSFGASSEIRNQIEGKQCTNRGSVTADFYAPNFGTGNRTSPEIHSSNRIYADGGGYVNSTDTNYDITLNGEHAGSSSTTGLTELAMAEISADNLKPGEVNRLVYDYDTSPGSHSVATTTDIILLYPNDTEIGYIGTPDELQDVRSLPNAAVYPENIYVDNDLFVGEESEVKFNVYNIGSRGGWFDIVVNDGTEDVYVKNNHYLSAFSSNPFAFEWTPTAETTNLTVSLVHTSVNLEERDSTNNTATKTLIVREREVPAIDDVYADDTVYEDSSYTVTADISSYADVLSVKFSVDGTELAGNVSSAVVGNTKRYWMTSATGLAFGEHEVSVVVTYTTGFATETVSEEFTVTAEKRPVQIPVISVYSDSTLMYGDDFIFGVYDIDDLLRTELSVDSGTATVTTETYTYENQLEYVVSAEDWGAGEHMVTINSYYQGENGEQAVTETYTITVVQEEDSYYSFSLDDTITSPSYSLYKTDYQYCWVESTENGYRFKKTVDMYENPEEYTLVVKHDSGMLVQSLNEEKPTLSTEGCSTLTITSEHDFTISYVAVEQIDSLDIQNIYLNKTDSMMFTPAVYSLCLYVNVDGYSFSIYPAMDLTEGDAVIDLDSYILRYTFKIENAANSWYNARLYYRYSESKYWNSYYLNTSYDSSENILECFTSDSHLLSNVENAEEVRIVVYSGDEVYITQVKAPVSTYSLLRSVAADEIYTLNREDLHEVKLVCEEDGLTVDSVEVSINDIDVTLYSDTIYVPAGDIDLAVALDIGTQTLNNEVSISVEEDCEVTVDDGLSENLADITIGWAEQYDEYASISCYNNGNYAYANEFISGNKFKTGTGHNSIDITLRQAQNRFYFSSYLYDLTDEGAEINIGSDFTANIDDVFAVCDGGDTISFYVDNIHDTNNNYMYSWNINNNQPLYGNAIFTDTEDEAKVFITPITTTSRWIEAKVPDTSGTYSITVELFSYVTIEHTHTYSEDWSKDTTNHWHVATCEHTDAIKDKAAHNYDDSADIICNTCGYERTIEHIHEWANEYSKDETGHWHECECGEKSDEATHADEDMNDMCDVCGYDMTPDHTHDYVSKSDASGHWTECSCGDKTEVAAHTDGNRDGKCDTCEYQVSDTNKPEADKPDFDYDAWYRAVMQLRNQKYTITAEAGDGGSITNDGKTTVMYDNSASYVITPDEGYEIEAVYVDGKDMGSISEYSFKRVNKNHTISVTFREIVWENPFTDIDENDWFYEDVEFVTENSLMIGTNTEGTEFSPDTALNRAMLVTILWRLEGEPIVDYPMQFEDVAEDEWYTEAIRWAAANGIILGYDGKFDPTDALSREQAAAILHRYAVLKGWDDGIILPMIPQYEYSDWAENDVIWADMNGMFDGIGTDISDLTESASRAEMAAYLRRFCENIAE